MTTTKELVESASRRIQASAGVSSLLRTEETPFLIMDREVLRQRYEELRRALPDAQVYYAMKANPDRLVVEFLRDLGVGFEISSKGELELLLALGVPPERIITSNPLKPQEFIAEASAVGVSVFAFDSESEIEKLALYAPGSRVSLRLSVSNEGSEWPLSRKFGVETERGIELLVQARERGLDPEGITFHVGSQCTNRNTWVMAIEKSRTVWQAMDRLGIKLRTLNIGGGFPIPYIREVPSTMEVADTVRDTVARVFPEGVKLSVEPGRVLVGEAGTIVASVIAKAKRLEDQWVYLDIGVFGGLMESIGGIKYPMLVERGGTTSLWVVAGPSCDSMDVITLEASLPELEIGDRVYILSAGAYTTAYASHFNGFPVPKTILL